MKVLMVFEGGYANHFEGDLTLSDQAALGAALSLGDAGIFNEVSVALFGLRTGDTGVLEYALLHGAQSGVYFFDQAPSELLIQARVLQHWAVHEHFDAIFMGSRQLDLASMLASILKQPLLLGVQGIACDDNEQWVVQHVWPGVSEQCLLDLPGVFVFDDSAKVFDFVQRLPQKQGLFQRVPINTLPLSRLRHTQRGESESLLAKSPGVRVTDVHTLVQALVAQGE